MSEFIKKYLRFFIGIPLGAVAGYAYYHFVGCVSGTCPITSNPYITVIYGAIIGYLVSDLFKKKKHGTN